MTASFTGGLSASLITQEVAFFFVQSQIRQQEEVEKRAEVAMEMSDLVVYCQPRSKEKDRFGKHLQTNVLNTKTCRTPPPHVVICSNPNSKQNNNNNNNV